MHVFAGAVTMTPAGDQSGGGKSRSYLPAMGCD